MASIRERVKSGGSATFAVLWRDRESGKQTSMTFGSREDASKFRRMIEANRGSLVPALTMLEAAAQKSPPLADVVESHIAGLASVLPRTRADYRRDAARHITPHLGHIPVAVLTARQVREWLNKLAESDLADKTIANVHGLLSAAIATAVEAGLRADNPCRGLRLPRRRDHEQTEMVCLTPAEWHAIDSAVGEIDTGSYRLAFQTLIGTGMRWGEMAALQAGDLNLDAATPTIRITRAVKRDEACRLYVGPTKTGGARRTVAIAADLAAQLRARVDGRAPADRVFSSPRGQLLNSGHARLRVWLRAVEASGIGRHPRIHDLRHTHASWLIASGVDMLTVQKRLGHKSITTTIDRYSHLMPAQQQAAADAIGKMLA